MVLEFQVKIIINYNSNEFNLKILPKLYQKERKKNTADTAVLNNYINPKTSKSCAAHRSKSNY